MITCRGPGRGSSIRGGDGATSGGIDFGEDG